jgi:hypothetical protein
MQIKIIVSHEDSELISRKYDLTEITVSQMKENVEKIIEDGHESLNDRASRWAEPNVVEN